MEHKTKQRTEIVEVEDIFTKFSGIEKIPKFSQICRVCLCETNESDQQLDTRIILSNNAQEIRSLLEESTGVQIVDLDFLPNHICDRCFKTLTVWYRFRSQTQRSNQILKEYLKKQSSSLDGNSLATTDLTIHMQGEKMNLVSTDNVSKIQDFQISFVKDKPEVVGFIFHCDYCTMTFTNQLAFDKHQEEHSRQTRQKSFKCNLCPKSFAFRNGMHNHMKLSHHHRTRYKFECDVCDRHFSSTFGFKMHKTKPCVPADLIEQCKIQKLDVGNEKLNLIAVTEKMISEAKISCILCKKSFKSHYAFIGHYPKHDKDKKCYICNKDFQLFKLLERHVRRHLHAYNFTCPICSRPFYSVQAFRGHMKEHGKREWIYRCNVCQKEFFLVRDFERHMVQHLEDEKKALEKTKHNVADVLESDNVVNIDIVNECDSNASAENNFNNQLETDISNHQDPFQLAKVEEDYESDLPIKPEKDTCIQIEMDHSIDIIEQEQQLIKIESPVHYQYETEIPSDHEGSNQASRLRSAGNSTRVKPEISVLNDITELENPESDNTISEDENADQTDDDISVLSKSNRQISKSQPTEHTQKLLDKCKVNCHVTGCQTKFTTLTEIWDHFKKKHLSKTKPFKCSECFEEFEKITTFRLHIKSYYTFQCPVCFKLKISSSELKKHIIQTHTIDRPFKCSKCDQTFKAPNALKVHETTHNNTKDFVCSVCSKDFFSYNGLYLHSKSHKDIKELQCPTCSRQLTSKDRLKRHMRINTCGRKRTNMKSSSEAKKLHKEKYMKWPNNIEQANESDSNTLIENGSRTESTYQIESL